MPTPSPAIEIKGIGKTYHGWWGRASTRALHGIDLSVERSAVCCVLGPNGAGKTTLISILCCLLPPDSGRGQVLGVDLVKERRKIRSQVNFTSGHANFPANFTVKEILAYFGMLYGLPGKQRLFKIDELLAFFELQRYRDVPFSHLSTGLKQRLALAKSLINDPQLLFLDEPTVGLDPAVASLIRSRLMAWKEKQGTTIVLTTHQMDEAELLSDTIVFLKDGEIFRMGRAQDLKDGVRSRQRLVIHGNDLENGRDGLAAILMDNLLEINETRICIQYHAETTNLNDILGVLINFGSVIKKIEVTQPTLGDIFIELAN